VTQLLQDLRAELVRRDYAPSTIRSYVHSLTRFASTPARGSIGSRRPSCDAATCSSWRSGG
jgi:hypothetical protein